MSATFTSLNTADMTGAKLRSLTTDDLMHMQENSERPRKRSRLSLDAEEDPTRNQDSDQSVENSDAVPSLDSEYDGEEDVEVGKEINARIGTEDALSTDKRHTSPTPKSTDEETAPSISRLKLKRRTSFSRKPGPMPSGLSPSSFSALGIRPQLQDALTSMAIRVPTEIQVACIPPLLAGKDCIGNAKTGSGKTIAFAIPILQQLSVDPYGIYALVLTPTRELAFQIAEQFAVLGNSLNIRIAVVVGGMDMMSQALELGNRPHIVIATPGRIVDHLRSSSGEWDLSRVKFLVLDEADRLLTPTFAPELAHLFGVLPKDRQTCLFTATLTPSIEQLADAPPRPGKEKPFIHRMRESVETVSTLKQHYILVPSHIREPYLFHLLCNPPESTLALRRAPPEPQKFSKKAKGKSKGLQKKKDELDDDHPEQPPPTIIFCARPRTAAYLTSLLKTLNIRSTALHSRLTQRERLNSLQLFRAYVVPVLISTDVGARGLDIEDVAIVINWDMPEEPEEYTHRVGRTARAGKGGTAISFVTERDEEKMLKVEQRINMKLAEMVLPEGRVLEKLNVVSTAKRLANMELHDSNFGQREQIHKEKKMKIMG